MSDHRFACGEDVVLSGGIAIGQKPGTRFEVVSLLPSDGTLPRYRIKAAHESFSRVAFEDTMTAATGPAPDIVPVALKRQAANHNPISAQKRARSS